MGIASLHPSYALLDFAMLDKEPLAFPSRNRFVYDPGIPDRQLWAIGMVVVQWSMTEWFMDMSIRNLIGPDQYVLEKYKKVRNFQQSVVFWKTQLELRSQDPFRSHMLSLIPRVQALSSQRDEVVHRMWGGGMEANSPSAAGLETADAGLMPNAGERLKTNAKDGPIPFTWNATFSRLRRMAADMATLNRDLLASSFLPNAAHGYVDAEVHVAASREGPVSK
jgi:hypothetical protein